MKQNLRRDGMDLSRAEKKTVKILIISFEITKRNSILIVGVPYCSGVVKWGL